MPLGTAHQTRTTGDKFIPELWINEIRYFLQAKLLAAGLVKMIPMVGRKGDTLHIPDLSELTANNKAANTQVTLQAPTETEFTMTINKHKEVSFLVEDILDIQEMYEIRSEYTSKTGYELGKAVDTDVWALQATVTRRVIGGDGSTAFSTASAGNGTDITAAGLRTMIEVQDTALVPSEDRYLVIHPSQKSALLAIDKFTEYQMLGPGGMPIRTGMFGEIYGIPVYVTTNLPAVTSAGPVNTFYGNFLIHRDAFVLAVQLEPRVQSNYILEYLGWLTVADCIYDVAIYRNAFATVFFGPA